MNKFGDKMYLAIFAGLAVLCIAGVFFMTRGYTTTIEFTRDELQEQTERFFAKQELGENVTFTDPEVIILDGSDRIGLRVGVTVSAFGHSGSGKVASTCYLSYVPAEAMFYITDPKIEELHINGVPKFAMSVITESVEKALARFAPRIPVYKLKDGNLKEVAAKLVLRKVEVKDGKAIATVSY